MTDRVGDEERIRKVESDYDRAWAASDVDAMVACMTDDAMVVNPRGEVARGKAEIKAHLGAFLKGPAHGSIHKSRIIRIEFLTPDVVVVDGEASISTPGLPEARPLTHRFTDIFVNDQGTWRIAHVRAYFLNGVTATNVEAAQQVAPADRSALPRRG